MLSIVLLLAGLIGSIYMCVSSNKHVVFLLDSLEKRNGFIQIIVMVILIGTFWTYNQANEINRKATIIAHTPWLTIDPTIALTPSTDNKTMYVEISLQNETDSPALHVRGCVDIFPTGKANPPLNGPERDVSKLPREGDVMPQQKVLLADAYAVSASPAVTATNLIAWLRISSAIYEIKVQYEDIFGETITYNIEETNDPSTHTFRITKTSITGFTAY